MKKLMGAVLLVLISGAGYSKEVLMDKSYYAWVDKLNLRDKPSLTSKVVHQLAEGEDVVFLGKKTKDEITIELRGVKYTAPWVLVQAENGKQGWVFAGALKKKNAMEVTVDKTSLFADPHSGALVLTACKKGEIVSYKQYQTDQKEMFKVSGKSVQGVWVMVETSKGYKGWIPAPYLKNVLDGKPDEPEAVKNKISTVEDLVNAIYGAESGEVITIAKGTYYLKSTLSIENKGNLTLAGEGEVNIYIKDENANVVDIYECKNIVLKNLHFKHYNPPKELICSGNVIYGYDNESLTLEDCTIDGSGYWGLWLSTLKSITIKNTKFLNHVDSSLEIYGVQNLEILGCEFKNNGGGINIGDCVRLVVDKCKFYDKAGITINEKVYSKKDFEKGILFDQAESFDGEENYGD